MSEIAQMNNWIGDGIELVRACPKIGRGTCSSIDECYSDIDLMGDIAQEFVAGTFGKGFKFPKTAEGVLAFYHDEEGIFSDMESDVRKEIF